jgi:hypothetical protein
MATTRIESTAPVCAPGEGEATVSCSECCALLPPEQALNVEAEDYAYHFCGADCYARWHARSGGVQVSAPPPAGPK